MRKSRGYIDLHAHCLAGVDDGPRTPEEAVELCKRLYLAGFDQVVATPHIHSSRYNNRRSLLQLEYERLQSLTAGLPDLPEILLAAEHFWNDVFWELFQSGEAVPYPNGKAILIRVSDGADTHRR